MCHTRRNLTIPKIETNVSEYAPSETEIAEAVSAKRGLPALFHHGDLGRLEARVAVGGLICPVEFFSSPMNSSRVEIR